MRLPEPHLPVHGGALQLLALRYGLAPEELLDFSANINPLGPPQSVVDVLADTAFHSSTVGQYPDPQARRFKDAISERYGVPAASIIVANGGAALIDAVVRSLAPTRFLVPVPAFSEYKRALHACACEFVPFPLDASDEFKLHPSRLAHALQTSGTKGLLLTNPHNPSGALTSRGNISEIIRAAGDLEVTVILDEAFIDYAEDDSVMDAAPHNERLIVLRSVTKFYAMPGLRVGYAVAHPRVAQRIAAFLPSWPASTIALEAAARAIHDPEYDRRTREQNAREKTSFAGSLAALGVRVTPSAANFLLLELPEGWGSSQAICERLITHFGIVVRDCEDYEGLGGRRFIRVAVRDAPGNARFLDALERLGGGTPNDPP